MVFTFFLYKFSNFNNGIGNLDSFPSILNPKIKSNIEWQLPKGIEESNCKLIYLNNDDYIIQAYLNLMLINDQKFYEKNNRNCNVRIKNKNLFYMTNKKLSVVVPVFNEEKNIKEFTTRLISSLKNINLDYEVVFVLDPSNDLTEEKILDEINQNKKIKLICMSRRFGQPQATIAGIQNISGDRCVVIDCDLQDPPELITEMNKKIDQGYDVVVAKRNKRAGETFIKKLITKIGYYFINKITEIKIPVNTGDYRIISNKVIREIKKFNDKSAFLRGLVSYIGFKQTHILYDRDKRNKGEGKYNRYFGS